MKEKEPKSLRTQYQVINDTKIRRNQKVIKDDKGKLTVKSYPKKEKEKPQEPKIYKKLFNVLVVIEMQWLNTMNIINVKFVILL